MVSSSTNDLFGGAPSNSMGGMGGIGDVFGGGGNDGFGEMQGT